MLSRTIQHFFGVEMQNTNEIISIVCKMLVFRADYRVQTPHEIFYKVLSVVMSEHMQKLPAA